MIDQTVTNFLGFSFRWDYIFPWQQFIIALANIRYINCFIFFFAFLIFGFFHGFGLATKLQDFALSSDGLITNLIAFNVGVEMGQILALSAILIIMGYWRRTRSFAKHAFTANVVLMTAGFVLTGYQLAGLYLGDPS